MNASDKKAVEQAKKGKAKGSRSQANAEEAQSQISNRIAQARRKTADAIKAQIIGGGVADALHEISMGDFGDVADGILEAFDSFIEGVDNQNKNLEAAEADPKYLLESGGCSGSSISSCYEATEN